jgi:2'-5' RNA ligase
MIEKSDKETARLFFALWPDGEARGALDRTAAGLHRHCGGRRTRPETIHLTLVFLGDVPLSRLDALREAAADICLPEFCVTISRTGWWRHNRIVWAGLESVPQPLADLVEQLRERLKNCGFGFDTKPYVPHVTLLRKAQCPDSEFSPLAVEWQVREFVLVRSVVSAAGAAYEIVGRWGFQR